MDLAYAIQKRGQQGQDSVKKKKRIIEKRIKQVKHGGS